MFPKKYIRIESSTQHSSVNDFVIINIPKEDVEPRQIILDPDDQPMWENAKIVAPTPNSAIIQLDVDDNFVINSTHLNMIWEKKFDGFMRANPHDHIREFLAICNMFRYVLFKLDWSTKSQNEHHQKSVAFADRSNSNDDNSRLMETLDALTIKMDSQFQSLKEEMHEMRKNYNNCGGDHASKNDDTPMCERHEVNYIRSEDYQNQNSHDSYSHQSHYDLNDSKKSLTELNNDVRNDLEDFTRCICSMRTDNDKLYERDGGKTTGVLPNKESKTVNQEPQSKTDLEKSITNFLDGQRVTNEWSKSQNVSSKQTDKTNHPLPPQAQTEHVNFVFTGSGKSDDSPKIKLDPHLHHPLTNKNAVVR
ncbi:hypothetical protein Tco_0608500 [Tanacetum coccineum]